MKDSGVVLAQLNTAATFAEAAGILAHWAQTMSSCESAMVRMVLPGEHGPWVPACVVQGPNEEFLRDETLINLRECICGRVAAGNVDPELPFFTAGGAFIWNQVGTIGSTFGPGELGSVRGRCIAEGFESVGVFPLGGGERKVGALHLASRQPGRFDDRAKCIEEVCRQAGGPLAELLLQDRGRSVASAICAALAPTRTWQIRRLRIAVNLTSATELADVGGDFYDVFDLREEGALLVVGDYSGRGVEAAGMASRARMALAPLASLAAEGPAAYLEAADEKLRELLPPDSFLCLAACVVGGESRSAAVALAGLPRPLKLPSGEEGTAAAGDLEIQAPYHPPLGIGVKVRYVETKTDLQPSDTLVLYTDGVSESRRGGRFFGPEGIAAACSAELQHASLTQIAVSICRASTEFHEVASGRDDRLVLVARIS